METEGLRISCIMPVNRDDGYLSEAISSILNQTFTNFELIIVANNCSDELWETLQKQTLDRRVSLFKTSISQLPFCLNFAIEQARGEFIARMDADDVSLPDRFEKQLKYFRTHEVDILGGNCDVIDENGFVFQTVRMAADHNDILKELPWSCPLVHPTVMFRKEALIKVRGYAYTFFAEDYELWLRIARTTNIKFANLSDVILKYREHKLQSTSTSNGDFNLREVSALLFREFLYTGRIVFILAILKRWIARYSFAKRFIRPVYKIFRHLESISK